MIAGILSVSQILDRHELNDVICRHALYLLVKLSANTYILPTSLFVQGVDIGSMRDPLHGGGFADIYRGRHKGLEVAVKKLRFSEEQRAHVHRVGHTPNKSGQSLMLRD
jgi:hypothetical protein